MRTSRKKISFKIDRSEKISATDILYRDINKKFASKRTEPKIGLRNYFEVKRQMEVWLSSSSYFYHGCILVHSLQELILDRA